MTKDNHVKDENITLKYVYKLINCRYLFYICIHIVNVNLHEADLFTNDCAYRRNILYI